MWLIGKPRSNMIQRTTSGMRPSSNVGSLIIASHIPLLPIGKTWRTSSRATGNPRSSTLSPPLVTRPQTPMNQSRTGSSTAGRSRSSRYAQYQQYLINIDLYKAFLDHNNIPAPQPRARDSYLTSARQNYDSVAKKLGEYSAYPGDWLYSSWSESDLKEYVFLRSESCENHAPDSRWP
jgi:hypothetical protein